MSIIMDRVNGKKAGWDTFGKAAVTGMVAGLFAAGANYFSTAGSAGEGPLVQWIVDLAYATLFTVGNLCYDLIVKSLKENHGR